MTTDNRRKQMKVNELSKHFTTQIRPTNTDLHTAIIVDTTNQLRGTQRFLFYSKRIESIFFDELHSLLCTIT